MTVERPGLRVWRAIDEYVLRHCPRRMVQSLRVRICRWHGGVVDDQVVIGPGIHLIGREGLRLARGVSIARDVTLDARGGLSLGEDALIGFETVLLTSTHDSSRVGIPVQMQGMYCAPVSVGARSWLGARVIVLPGISIGADVIVGSGSVVTKNLASNSIYAGVPARKIRDR